MRLYYGSYAFAVDGVHIGTDSETMYDEAMVPYARRVTARVSGALLGSSQSDLTTQSGLLEIALRIPYQDLALYQDSGVISATALVGAYSLTGVTVTRGPTFGGQRGWEYASGREFSFEARVDVPLTTSLKKLLSFSESLSFSGGGPLYVVKRAIAGPMQRQLIYPQTEYRATQSGHATGFLAYPSPPRPLWPSALAESPNFRQEAPARTGPTYQRWGISWEYRFESIAPLVGVPNVWPLDQ